MTITAGIVITICMVLIVDAIGGGSPSMGDVPNPASLMNK
tara:strand:- start:3072 stop:3191 length:120 start_codon:yes stop_codon:yes gene_type:complete